MKRTTKLLFILLTVALLGICLSAAALAAGDTFAVYNGDTLTFCVGTREADGVRRDADNTLVEGTVYEDFLDFPFEYNIDNNGVDRSVYMPWHAIRTNVTTVCFADVITPTKTCGWFFGFSRLTRFENFDNFWTENVTNMTRMFNGCSSLTNIPFGEHFLTGSLTNAWGMFFSCSKITCLDLHRFDFTSVKTVSSLFSGCSLLEEIVIGPDFHTERAGVFFHLFNGCRKLPESEIKKVLGRFKVEEGENTNFFGTFSNCKMLENIDLTQFYDGENVTMFQAAFSGCDNLRTVSVANMITTKTTDLSKMFSGCNNLETIEFGDAFTTENVTDMQEMFKGCLTLSDETLAVIESLDTHKVRYMQRVFQECNTLTALNLSGWDLGKVIKMNDMFKGCTALKELKLGEHFRFVEADTFISGNSYYTSRDAMVPVVPTNDIYSGYWKLEDSVPIRFLSASDLMATYNGAMAGTWVWETRMDLNTMKNAGRVTVDAIPDQYYTGNDIEPGVHIYLDGVELVAGTDYSVTYQNNRDPGTAAVTVTGAGRFTGVLILHFNILTRDLAIFSTIRAENIVQAWRGPTETKVVVKDGTVVLQEGVDYTLEYRNNEKPGIAEVTAHGIGKYSGSQNTTYLIYKRVSLFDFLRNFFRKLLGMLGSAGGTAAAEE